LVEGPQKATINNFCRELQIENIIIRPFTSQENLCKYYALASALVLPSRYGETWGLVVNEAMASGLPVIVSDQCGCATSLVKDGKNGFLFSPDSTSELTATLLSFMTLAVDDRLAMGKRSQDIINEWSLDRFSQAAWRAIQHGLEYPQKLKLVPDSLIINLWKGRYRPT
jgi:glycosyltransferase involved in cell wall biosynthesis